MNYIGQILDNRIVAHCSDKAACETLLAMGASHKVFDRKRLEFKAESKEALARALERLRDAGFLFVGGSSGWPPSAVFASLRDEGLVEGTINVVTWRAKNDPVVEEAR